ncbi:MAG: phospho-N-acetylmuramoyl-pentapeptide-transferase [Gammaproteobacteria bacterium]|nr:phospho-N-acetylmuramoyl-pentapeptide-transferase [Gammaproteobacteria bacterium]
MTSFNWFIIAQTLIFLVSFCFVKYTLPIFKKLNCKQLVRDDGPRSHLYKKNTPTMGGLYFILFMTIYVIVTYVLKPYILDGTMLGLYILFMMFGLLGFIDDFCKLYMSKGLSMTIKMSLQVILSLLWSYYFMPHHTINVPGLMSLELSLTQSILWGSFVIVASANAINFTDGLDGLMIQTVLMVMFGFIFISYTLDQTPSLFYMGVFSCLILLMVYPFNTYPAKIFIGDTGSMSIGAIVAGLALLQNIEIPFILMGIVFVFETLSVAIQIISFKLFKKRVFKMAPIHHSFELSGWHEQEIVRLFTIITLIGTFIALWWIKG